MWQFGIWIHSLLTSVGVVHSTWPFQVMWHMHAPTFNTWHQKKKKKQIKKVTLHILTHGAMWGCGLTSLVVCINDKIRDLKERNVTIRIEIWTTNIGSLGFPDIREWVILWRFLLWSLGCNSTSFLDWTPIFWLLIGSACALIQWVSNRWCFSCHLDDIFISHFAKVKLHPLPSVMRSVIHWVMAYLIFVLKVGKWGGGMWLWGVDQLVFLRIL